MPRDLSDPRWMYAKAIGLVLIGVLSAVLLVIERPVWRTVVLLGVCVWAFCRAYYFAFYVVQHYVDPGYRFAGLIDFVRYLRRRRREPD